jgi:hypothetical protein
LKNLGMTASGENRRWITADQFPAYPVPPAVYLKSGERRMDAWRTTLLSTSLLIMSEDRKMRQVIASLVLAVSILGLAACSNGGSSSFVPAASQSEATHTTQGWGGAGYN